MKVNDLEEKIMSCWQIVDDIELIIKQCDNTPVVDALSSLRLHTPVVDALSSLRLLYNMKFQDLFDSFELVLKTGHEQKKVKSSPLLNPMNPDDREQIKTHLQTRIVKVAFFKSNGDYRVMNCTTCNSFIPQEKQPTGNSTRVPDPEIQRVFDVDIVDWRSFRWSSVDTVRL